jgi:hypothetical protein
MISKDKYLQKKYGISLAEYQTLLLAQHGVCAICGAVPRTRALHVDHDHSWKKIKISCSKVNHNDWVAYVSDGQILLSRYRGNSATGSSAKEARQYLKDWLQRKSVRGALCYRCNRGLQFYSDSPQRMENAAKYLRKHQGGYD